MADSIREPAIETAGVKFSYDAHPVLEDVSIRIDQGDFVAVVGPNGGGKTTLIKILLGLLEPSSGRVRIFGKEVLEARGRIGYMPQYSMMDPSFPVNVMDVVLMGRLGRGGLLGYNQNDRRAALRALDQVGLADLASRPFSAISGGQRQRALIARALATDPDLLLLDEPTANVDPAGEEGIYELFQKLNQSMTIVVVSHDIGFVSPHVCNVVCVNRTVVTHPTCEITGQVISEIYGRPVSMVRHDHSHPGGRCDCA